MGTEMLYRASRDGWAAEHFHAACDGGPPIAFVPWSVTTAHSRFGGIGLGATVTLIKSADDGKGSFVFGGFADASWDNNGSKSFGRTIASAGEAFLFSVMHTLPTFRRSL